MRRHRNDENIYMHDIVAEERYINIYVTRQVKISRDRNPWH